MRAHLRQKLVNNALDSVIAILNPDFIETEAMSELIITKLSHCSAPVSGGKEMILLCDRVTKDDVQGRQVRKYSLCSTMKLLNGNLYPDSEVLRGTERTIGLGVLRRISTK